MEAVAEQHRLARRWLLELENKAALLQALNKPVAEISEAPAGDKEALERARRELQELTVQMQDLGARIEAAAAAPQESELRAERERLAGLAQQLKSLEERNKDLAGLEARKSRVMHDLQQTRDECSAAAHKVNARKAQQLERSRELQHSGTRAAAQGLSTQAKRNNELVSLLE